MNSFGLGDGPIADDSKVLLEGLAQGIDDVLNGTACRVDDKTKGFILLTFPFGEVQVARCNVVSNSKPGDLYAVMRELVDRMERGKR